MNEQCRNCINAIDIDQRFICLCSVCMHNVSIYGWCKHWSDCCGKNTRQNNRSGK